MADRVPYGISRGEYEGRGPQKKWDHGRYRSAAVAAEGKSRLDANQSRESNIRERQATMKNNAAVDARLKKTAKRKTGRGAKTRSSGRR